MTCIAIFITSAKKKLCASTLAWVCGIDAPNALRYEVGCYGGMSRIEGGQFGSTVYYVDRIGVDEAKSYRFMVECHICYTDCGPTA